MVYFAKRAQELKTHICWLPVTRFVQPGKIEIDANERAVIKEFMAAFSFAPSSILSLTIYHFQSNYNQYTTSRFF
jgi:hypothetical protein